MARKGDEAMGRKEPLNDTFIMNINKGIKNQAMILADRQEMNLSQLVRMLLKNYVEENGRTTKRKRQIKRAL